MALHEIAVAPEISAVSPLLEWVEQCCRDDGLDSELTFKMVLLIEEAVTNVVSYAFADLPPPHTVRLRLEITPQQCAAEIADNGRPFDPSAAPDPDLEAPLEQRDAGGLGIHLMRQMADRLEYRRDGDHNRLRIEKDRR